MKRSRKILIGMGGAAVLAFAALAISMLVISNQYPTTQTVVRSFTLPDNFTKVRGILISSNATKQIIVLAQDNEFLDEKWTALKPEKDALVMNAQLKVRSRDDYVDRPVVQLSQVVTIRPDEILSDIKMNGSSTKLLEYQIVTHYTRNEKDKNTKVDLRLTQRIVTTAPWFAHAIADDRVRASAERQLVHQERAIRELIEKAPAEKPGLFSTLKSNLGLDGGKREEKSQPEDSPKPDKRDDTKKE